jgi:hypothetical protein
MKSLLGFGITIFLFVWLIGLGFYSIKYNSETQTWPVFHSGSGSD